jgi:hypothetical protein
MLAVQIAIGAAIAWLRPYGTRDFAPTERFLFWMLVIPTIGLLVSPSIRLIARSERARTWHPVFWAVGGALLASLPASATSALLQWAFGHPPRLVWNELGIIYLSTTTIIALISIPITLIVARRVREEAREAAPAATPNGSPFLKRIPPRLGGELLSIATEDHYLRVATERGSDLVLYRLSDAVAELDPGLGLQVHRSHWVARRAVRAVERDGHRTWLVLTTGQRIPVSRTYRKALRRAGWLES